MSVGSSRITLVLLGVFILLPEVVLVGADQGVWGSADWRAEAYRHGAFWSGLLAGWSPLYPKQTLVMFVSHGFLHDGALHLVMNLATLASLGAPILRDVGHVRFLALYGAAMIGGGGAFALLGPVEQPMVGASGALFGLAGALVCWRAIDAWRDGDGFGGLGRALTLPSAALLSVHIILHALADGQIAWQAHLGGYIVGLMAAPMLDLRANRTVSA